jgi:hypothetical protein
MAARSESLFPIERKLARLTTVSSESLASAAEFQTTTSLPSEDLAATTVPRPKTMSRTPIVLMSKREDPLGSSVPDQRIGALGATNSATPTDARSHPILWFVTMAIAAAYRTMMG